VVSDEVDVLLESGGRGSGRAEDDTLVVDDGLLRGEGGGVELAGEAGVDGPLALAERKTEMRSARIRQEERRE
jgi:hypothetical protein